MVGRSWQLMPKIEVTGVLNGSQERICVARPVLLADVLDKQAFSSGKIGSQHYTGTMLAVVSSGLGRPFFLVSAEAFSIQHGREIHEKPVGK